MNQITITDAARSKIKEELEKRSNIPGVYLRLGVRGSGCSGHQYVFIFENKDKRDKDTQIIFGDVEIIVDNKSLVLLNGLTLDYQETLMKQGFVFNNPNAIGSCGCGKSFSTK